MSYTALYRKYRPDTFDEVKGQDHVVTTLRNQILADRVGHAYLFTGTRGTGKTSAAKIFARAVNCENPQNGNPCNACACCRGILGGSLLNVIEIDAASNNGVDDIRRIREEVAYAPTQGKYKVYIIDEAHMVTPQAFNALLKTLEEPPAYVIFILATTDAHKIPVTILSRCQRYDFRRISQEEITDRLTKLLDREHVAAEEKALRYIARKADGGLRDALSLLDQCIAFYLGETLTYQRVLDVLGAVDTEVFGRLYGSILEGDVAGVFTQLEDLIYQGRDLSQLVGDMTEYLRDLLLLKSTDQAEQILDVSKERYAALTREADLADEQSLLRHIRIFSELGTRLRFAANRRVEVEVALVKLCRPQMETDVRALADRIRTLERMVEQGILVSPAGKGGTAGSRAGMQSAPLGESKSAGYTKAAPEQLQRLRASWGQITHLTTWDPVFRHLLEGAQLHFDTADSASDCVYLVTDDVGAGLGSSSEQTALLEESIQDLIGTKIRVRIVPTANAGGTLKQIQVEERIHTYINAPIEQE